MKATKRLIGAVVALVAALAVSVGATFAWFTTQNTASVKQFEVSVRDATGNLYIGTSAENVSAAPLDISGETGVKDVKLKDLTLDEGGTKLQDKSQEDATDGYVHFTLYFEATTDIDVYLTTESKIEYNQDGSTATHHALSVNSAAQTAIGSNYGTAVSGTLETNAANAMRVKFGTGKTNIWAPNEAADETNSTSSGKGFWKNNLAADYEKYIDESTGGTWSVTSQAFSAANTVKTAAKTASNANDETKICDLTEQSGVYKGSVEVWIWIEGTDGDCLNSIFSDVLQIDLQFIGLTAPAAAG